MFSFKNIERKKKQKKLFESIWWSSVCYFENSSVEVLTESRSLKIFQEEELEDSEESGDWQLWRTSSLWRGKRLDSSITILTGSFNPDWSFRCWNLWNSWVMEFYNQVEEGTHAKWFCVGHEDHHVHGITRWV